MSEEWGDDSQLPVELKLTEVNDSQLEMLIQEFIQPGGTDYGLSPEEFAAKERLARKQIASGTLRIIFDAGSDTTTLMSSQDWRQLSAKFNQ